MPGLEDVELALLRSLDVLLAERHVTRAARRLGITQSAMSHRLRQLRDVFDDPLLVAAPGGGLVATPRAEALMVPIRAALRDLDAALRAASSFDEATAVRTFAVATTDYALATAVPRVVEEARRRAPGVSFTFEAVRPDSVDRLGAGTLDAMVTARPQQGAGLRRRLLRREGFRVLARRDHPRLAGVAELDVETFVTLDHVLVAPEGRAGGFVDAALERLGRRRHVAVRLTSFVPAPFLVARSDLVVTVPTPLADAMVGVLPLVAFDPPVALAEVDAFLFWHERADADPGHRWLRATIVDGVDEVPGS